MPYAVVIEKGAANSSAYAPDLPGCATVGGALAVPGVVSDDGEQPVTRKRNATTERGIRAFILSSIAKCRVGVLAHH